MKCYLWMGIFHLGIMETRAGVVGEARVWVEKVGLLEMRTFVFELLAIFHTRGYQKEN